MPPMRKSRRPSCRYRPVCAELRGLLRRGGVHKSAIQACPPVPLACPCASFVGNARSLYHSLPGDHAGEVLAFLHTVLGKKEPLVLPEFFPKLRKSDFYCPELRIMMHQPCRIKSCPFRTNKPVLGNCIMNYLVQQERSSLNYNDLTILLQEPTGALRSRVNSGLRKLRVGALRDQIRCDHEVGLFRRIPGATTVCTVCERVLEPKQGVTKSRRRYCSQECFAYKPPHLLALEDAYGLPVERLLKICAASFTDTARMAPLLHLPQSALPDLFARFGLPIPPPQS